MQYKIAVASSDGKTVTHHFGSCRKFLILDVDDTGEGTYSPRGFREIEPACNHGEHSQSGLDTMADILSDCLFVLVNCIGPGARAVLQQKGITALEYEGSIDPAVKKITAFYKDKI